MIFIEPGIAVEQIPFAKLKCILLGLDNKYCNEAHLRSCKEGRARDISKEGLLRLLELVTGIRRTYTVTDDMASEDTCMHIWKKWYQNLGSRFQQLRLPIDFGEEGAYTITKMKGSLYLKSIADAEPLDLKAILPGIDARTLQLRFEENWGKTCVMVLGPHRFECSRFFPELQDPHRLALEDGDAPDADSEHSTPAAGGSPRALEDEPPRTPVPKRARLMPTAKALPKRKQRLLGASYSAAARASAGG